MTRQYDQQNKCVVKSTLQVNSGFLKDVLRKIIGTYPGISFDTKAIAIDLPAHCLYHYLPELRDELARIATDDPGSEAEECLVLLVQFIEEEFKDTILDVENLLEKGLITYQHLWAIFKPGTQVYSVKLSQSRVHETSSTHYVCGNEPGMQIHARFVDYDGCDFGFRIDSLLIPAFRGSVSITNLPVFPLHSHSNETKIRETIVQRGRKWEEHAGQKFCEYSGVAIDPKGHRFNIEGRVMVDKHTFHRIEADHAYEVSKFPKPEGMNDKLGRRRKSRDSEAGEELPAESVNGDDEEHEPLTDEQCLLSSPLVRGFSFTEKKFLSFFVDKLSPIEWNTSCFEQLVLPESQKELVQALVAEHTQRTSTPANAAFDDIVKGKGRGLIMVLHGPPGVGKTLTAECVAEFSKRPLYIVSSGDLGTTTETLDQKLARTLDLASTWKAVLLIDEADVFLERRSLHDMERNGLVSIFLRTMEYYTGIMFMTTNRVSTFDDAFKSRIHVPLKYGDLNQESRLKIWKTFLERVDAGMGGVDIDEDGYLELAQEKLNGRQIKGVVRTAQSLAAHKGVKLDKKLLLQVVQIQMAFEEDLSGAGTDA